MVRLKAHFDGRVLVPDEPVDLPTGVALDVVVQAAAGDGCPDVLAFEGLGADLWEGVDPVEYQRREREGWE
jgi:hypothetical protein